MAAMTGGSLDNTIQLSWHHRRIHPSTHQGIVQRHLLELFPLFATNKLIPCGCLGSP